MAQRTENEEINNVPETTTLNLCINNCGLTGSPSTNNMCQNCFSSSTTTRNNKPRSSSSSSSLRRDVEVDHPLDPTVVVDVAESVPVVEKKVVNRCSGCRKRVGLTGFRCRCGELYCEKHRYSDRHECSYDYKTVGREAIARDNPVVKASKLVRI